MSLRHPEINPEPGDAFGKDKLGRQKYAEILTTIVNSYKEGFVMSINGKWGSGKTTFVKMWRQSLTDQKYQTIYFNAWENDFDNNPLAALMGELKGLVSPSSIKFKKVLKSAATLSKHIAPHVVEAIVERYINTKGIKQAFVKATEGISEIFENEIEEYADKKKSTEDFRRYLTEFISENNPDNALIFFVDELDRCRPDYAVSILEKIKHFFSIPNIVFVLSIDKEQLCHAVRGVYGSENLDADEYLRRFIDVDYTLPEPEGISFAKYLYEYFDFEEFFQGNNDNYRGRFPSNKERFLGICDLLFPNSSLPLRQQEKIFVLARLGLRAIENNYYVVPEVFLFLTFLKVIQPVFYNDLKSKKTSLTDLQEKLYNFTVSNNNEETDHLLMMIEARLLIFYNNYRHLEYNRKPLYEYIDSEVGYKLLYQSKINPTKDKEFLDHLKNLSQSQYGGDLGFEYFFNKLDLLENLEF